MNIFRDNLLDNCFMFKHCSPYLYRHSLNFLWWRGLLSSKVWKLRKFIFAFDAIRKFISEGILRIVSIKLLLFWLAFILVKRIGGSCVTIEMSLFTLPN
jgi:hypothetical protein